MKKLLAVALTVLLVLGLCGCAPADAPKFLWPVTGFEELSRGFSSDHRGVDIMGADIKWAPVTAAADGKVSERYYSTLPDGDYGVYLVIEHEGGYTTLYSHLFTLAVVPGATVRAGELIGYVGTTGNATGYHLHFEIRKNSVPLDPMIFY